MSDQQPAFDPSKYLTKVGNADYLPVKWRLVWLRDVHPDAVIETQAVTIEDDFAVFRAHVVVPGGGKATGYGSEGIKDFRDFIEKAETKAIGRALAALGFGTQFCEDFDDGARDGNVVDSPVDRGSRRSVNADTPRTNPPETANAPANNQTPNGDVKFVNERQLKFIWALAREAGMSDEEVHGETFRQYEKTSTRDLTIGEASAFIDWLQAKVIRPDSAPAATGQPTGQQINDAFDTLWKELIAAGVRRGGPMPERIAEAEAIMGVKWDQKDPYGMLTALRNEVAKMPKAGQLVTVEARPEGQAGNDKFTA